MKQSSSKKFGHFNLQSTDETKFNISSCFKWYVLIPSSEEIAGEIYTRKNTGY